MFCTKCGTAIDAGAKFCPGCGTEQRFDAYGVSPAAMSAAAPTPANSYYTAIIGPKNQAYYLEKFEQFDRAGKAGASWHWPSLFVAFYWLLYRKMWLPAVAYFLAPYVLMLLAGIVAGGAAASGHGGGVGAVAGLLYLAYILGIFILMPMYANALYYKHCKKQIAAAIAASPDPQRQLGELTARGGTSGIIVVILVLMIFVAMIGIVAAVSIPAYQSYVARSQIAEALSLADSVKVPLAGFYGKNGSCPGSNDDGPVDDIPVASSLSGTYVKMVETSADTPCAIIATMKSTGVVNAIAGKTLVLQMHDDAGTLSWTCYSPEIKQSYLPKSCQAAPPASP